MIEEGQFNDAEEITSPSVLRGPEVTSPKPGDRPDMKIEDVSKLQNDSDFMVDAFWNG